MLLKIKRKKEKNQNQKKERKEKEYTTSADVNPEPNLLRIQTAKKKILNRSVSVISALPNSILRTNRRFLIPKPPPSAYIMKSRARPEACACVFCSESLSLFSDAPFDFAESSAAGRPCLSSCSICLRLSSCSICLREELQVCVHTCLPS